MAAVESDLTQGNELLGDEEDAAKKAAAKLADEQWAADLRWLMGDRRGRRVMWRLLAEASMYESVFSQSHASMAFLEGKRNVGLFLVDQTQTHCGSDFLRMHVENRRTNG